ncbi:hypothetical protein ACWERW_35475 [Streptomyces sp. NPDC004012]
MTEEIAAIAGTTLATAAFGGVESITVDLAVAQPTAIALGEQKTGINLDEARQAGVDGALLGGALGGGGSALRAARTRAAGPSCSAASACRHSVPRWRYPAARLPVSKTSDC